MVVQDIGKQEQSSELEVRRSFQRFHRVADALHDLNDVGFVEASHDDL